MIITGKKFSKPEMSRVINGDVVLDRSEEKPEKFRLDHLMMKRYPAYNRATLQKFITNGFVSVNDAVANKANQKFLATAKIELNVPTDIKNSDLTPEILYEDKDVLVLNKPAGLLSTPRGAYCPEKTLEDFGLLVHRLDRDTSGVVILAKSPEVQSFLRKQFQSRQTQKTYFAIVVGRPKLDEARVDLPIARDLKRPTTFRVDPSGRQSETYYKVIKANDDYSLVELKPKTGRTHQLRVHMKYLGTPILGDTVYSAPAKSSKTSPKPSDPLATNTAIKSALASLPKRLYLHAYQLLITLPSGERKSFTATLPPEFTDVFRES